MKLARACSLVLLLLLAALGPLGAAEEAPPAKPSAPVDINKANAEQLATVPGIGKVTAEKIIEWRDEHGPFQKVEDLMKVKGIGEKSFEKIRPHVKVSTAK
jgi:competence protein ComEA